MRGKTVQVKCKFCGGAFPARVADRKRGWARFCSKSCKAKEQEGRTHQHRDRLRGDRHCADGGNSQYDRNGEYVGFTFGGGNFE